MNPRERLIVAPPPPTVRRGASVLAQAMATTPAASPNQGGTPNQIQSQSEPQSAAKPPATETIARRMGAMVDEVDFPGFVAGLVHGTYDAIVDASIRQMESYAGLVGAVAKTVDQFTAENITPNQARDWLVSRYPADVRLVLPNGAGGQPRLEPRVEGATPTWLGDYGLDGEELTTELLEEQVIGQVRQHMGTERQQLLATMVMLGMNRVAVRDGSITAKVMFRAAAQDSAKVGYAVGSDPQSVANWGERGSLSYGGASTQVSTLAINAQSESSVRADLFGEVKLNFVSETLPLEKLAEAAKVALIQRHAPAVRNIAAPAAAPANPPIEGSRGGQ